MKKLFLVAALMFSVATLSAQTFINNPESCIEVIGQSKISLTPDIFHVAITINEGDSRGRITAAEQQRKMVSALKKIGVDTAKDLKINSLSSVFEKRNKAYSAISYSLRLTSEETLVEAFEIFDKLYISNVGLESVESSKYESAKGEARKNALLQAREAAQASADALGQSLGKCFYIYDMSNDNSPMSYYRSRPMAYVRGASAAESNGVDSAPLDVKEIDVEYRVKTKFYLQ